MKAEYDKFKTASSENDKADELDELREKVESMEGLIDDQKDKIEKLTSEFNSGRKEITEKGENIVIYLAEIDKLKGEVAELKQKESDNEDMQKELESYKELADENYKDLEKIKRERDKLQKEMSEKGAHTVVYLDEIDKLKREFEDKNRESGGYLAEVSMVRKERDSLDAELSQLKYQHEEHKQSHEDSKKSNIQMQAEIDGLRAKASSELDDHRKKHQERENEWGRARRELEEQLDEETKGRGDLKAEVSQLQQEISTLALKQQESTKMEAYWSEKVLASLYVSFLFFLPQVAESEKLRMMEVDYLKADILKRNEVAVEEIEALKAELREKDINFQNLKQELHSEQTSRSSNASENEKLRSEVTEKENQIKQLETETTKREKEMHQREKELKDKERDKTEAENNTIEVLKRDIQAYLDEIGKLKSENSEKGRLLEQFTNTTKTPTPPPVSAQPPAFSQPQFIPPQLSPSQTPPLPQFSSSPASKSPQQIRQKPSATALPMPQSLVPLISIPLSQPHQMAQQPVPQAPTHPHLSPQLMNQGYEIGVSSSLEEIPERYGITYLFISIKY